MLTFMGLWRGRGSRSDRTSTKHPAKVQAKQNQLTERRAPKESDSHEERENSNNNSVDCSNAEVRR